MYKFIKKYKIEFMQNSVNKTETGKYGEGIAVIYLVENGHKILERNFNCKLGEIDIITLFKNNLYIYEVKYRRNLEYGYGDDSINSQKIKRIQNTLEIWLSHNKSRYYYKNLYLNAIVIDPDLSIHEFEVL